MNSGPDREETLSYEQMERILTELFATAPLLHIVIFAGGEPLLLGDDLLKAIRLCRQNGKGTRVVTNAFWAHSIEQGLAGQPTAYLLGFDPVEIRKKNYVQPEDIPDLYYSRLQSSSAPLPWPSSRRRCR